MPVPWGASTDVFNEASYTVQTVYRWDGEGILLFMTSGESNTGGSFPDLWDVFYLPGAMPFDVLPFRYTEAPAYPLGTFAQYWPPIRDRTLYPTMFAYCAHHHPGDWYRHWVGYSMWYHTLDRNWHALDLYWQPPQMYRADTWIWYCVLDETEPREFWRGKIVYFNGYRVLGPEEICHARM